MNASIQTHPTPGNQSAPSNCSSSCLGTRAEVHSARVCVCVYVCAFSRSEGSQDLGRVGWSTKNVTNSQPLKRNGLSAFEIKVKVDFSLNML